MGRYLLDDTILSFLGDLRGVIVKHAKIRSWTSPSKQWSSANRERQAAGQALGTSGSSIPIT